MSNFVAGGIEKKKKKKRRKVKSTRSKFKIFSDLLKDMFIFNQIRVVKLLLQRMLPTRDIGPLCRVVGKSLQLLNL